jgi:hypothetical protein
MSNRRCFDTNINTMRNTSSDFTNIKRQSVLYADVALNINKLGNANPVKINGHTYNNNYYATDCLKSAKNYSLLLDITKGRRYVNPVYLSTSVPLISSVPLSESWSGNLIGKNYITEEIDVLNTKTTFFKEAEQSQLLYGIAYPEKIKFILPTKC